MVPNNVLTVPKSEIAHVDYLPLKYTRTYYFLDKRLENLFSDTKHKKSYSLQKSVKISSCIDYEATP